MLIESHHDARRRFGPAIAASTPPAAAATANLSSDSAVPKSAPVALPPEAEVPDAPSLPDPTGPSATARQVARSVTSTSFAEGGDGLFAVLQIMTGARMRDIHLARLFKGLHNALQMDARGTELQHKVKEIAGERFSSLVRVAGYVAATGASFTAGAIGGSLEYNGLQGLGDNVGRDLAVGASLKNASGTLGQAVSSTSDAFDRTGVIPGGRFAADRAIVAQRDASRQAQVAQSNVDAAGSWLDQAQEARKAAQSAIMAAVQMWRETLANTLWR